MGRRFESYWASFDAYSSAGRAIVKTSAFSVFFTLNKKICLEAEESVTPFSDDVSGFEPHLGPTQTHGPIVQR
jgi:hypothetical protein